MSESPIPNPVEPQNDTPQASTPEVNDRPNSCDVSREPSTSVSDSLARTRKTFSAITEFLTIPTVASKKSKGKGKSPGGARVLTSEDSLTLMLDKEKKRKEGERLSRRENWSEKRNE